MATDTLRGLEQEACQLLDQNGSGTPIPTELTPRALIDRSSQTQDPETNAIGTSDMGHESISVEIKLQSHFSPHSGSVRENETQSPSSAPTNSPPGHPPPRRSNRLKGQAKSNERFVTHVTSLVSKGKEKSKKGGNSTCVVDGAATGNVTVEDFEAKLSKNLGVAFASLINKAEASGHDQEGIHDYYQRITEYQGGDADDEKLVSNAINKFKSKPTPVDDLKTEYRVNGLKISLKAHQIIAIGWMFSQERTRTQGLIRGGMLCDKPGLGKTFDAIALILGDGPYKSRKGPTLIVIPANLMTHWKTRLSEEFCDNGALEDVLEFKQSSKHSAKAITTYQIVLVSYTAVRQSYQDPDPPENCRFSKSSSKSNKNDHGLLFKIEWRRIILDEAHEIRNHLSKTSKAIRALKGKWRWIITGTPLHNEVEEFFPYFNFLRIPDCETLTDFKKKYFTKEAPNQTLYEDLALVFHRYTYEKKLFGSPIVSLPDITLSTTTVNLCQIELLLFERVRSYHMGITLGMVGEKRLQQIFVMFTNLRMLCSHPFTLWEKYEKPNSENGTSILSPSFLDELRKACKNEINPNTPAARIVSSILIMEKSVMMPTSPLKSPERFPKENTSKASKIIQSYRTKMLEIYYKKDPDWNERKIRSHCPICQFPPYQGFITSCNHVYCEDCFDDLTVRKEDVRTCVVCNESIEEFASSVPFDKASHQTSIEKKRACASKDSTTPKNGNKRTKGCKSYVRVFPDVDDIKANHANEDGEPSNNQKAKNWIEALGPQVPGAKLDRVRHHIREWIKNDSSVKIVVFTLFLNTLKILKYICEDELKILRNTSEGKKCEPLVISGEISLDTRNKTLETFRSSQDHNILLATLRTGGTGLDLSCANKCILIDLWWTEAVEDQAQSRLIRFGQKREVECLRIVSGELDEKILEIQDCKIDSIENFVSPASTNERSLVKRLLEALGPAVEDKGSLLYAMEHASDEENAGAENNEIGDKGKQPVHSDDEGF